MPVSAAASSFDLHPRLWDRCRREVADAMVADGWSRHAGKFTWVMLRRARRLFMSRLP
jgi:hypothetical protein